MRSASGNERGHRHAVVGLLPRRRQQRTRSTFGRRLEGSAPCRLERNILCDIARRATTQRPLDQEAASTDCRGRSTPSSRAWVGRT